MSALLRALRERGVLSPLDFHFARTVARLGGETRDAVVLAAALASRQVEQGHVCLELPRLFGGAPVVDAAGEPVAADTWPALDEWLAALRASALVGEAGGPTGGTPLVLDRAGRLYLRRYWEYETRLAAAIGARAAAPDASVDLALLRDGVRRLFESAPGDEPDWQRVAAFTAVRRRFCVVSGGPGTGKTFTVAKLLALLVEQALRADGRAPRILLLAPTGKAAARLGEAITAARAHLACSPEVSSAIPGDASTIHRALGTRPGRVRGRHSADEPLLADVVLVDEASMVDLALMARLVDAMPPAARLILLGDQDQLASVEAGAILGDICDAGGARRRYSRAFVADVAAGTGDRIPLAADAPADTGIWDCVVQLTHSYRYGSASRIARLARAINAGDAAAVLEVFAPGSEASRYDPLPVGELGGALCAELERGLHAYVGAGGAAAERLAALSRFRVLCAHRRGPGGVETLNDQIEHYLRQRGVIRGSEAFYLGRPLLVTRNDYQLRLFNGDVGLVVEDPERPGGRVAYFTAGGGRQRWLSPARLPECETVFAMTVHKSQGSEFDEVAVVLPDKVSPVVTRELLYTAVTRARAGVSVYAAPEVIRHAVAQRVARASGLRDALWQPGGRV